MNRPRIVSLSVHEKEDALVGVVTMADGHGHMLTKYIAFKQPSDIHDMGEAITDVFQALKRSWEASEVGEGSSFQVDRKPR